MWKVRGQLGITQSASSSSRSPTQDSQSIIADLQRQISDLKRQVRDKTPVKEKLRRGCEENNRENSEAFSNAHSESKAEIPSRTKKNPGSVHSKPPSKGPSQHPGGDALPPRPPKKRGNRGEQGAVWKALDQISSSPFSEEIERAKLPPRYTAPAFEMYNGRTDPIAHIGHYHQRMALSLRNDALMCKLFPSSLGEVALRWFNQIDRGTISSWDQMAEAFVGKIHNEQSKTQRYSETYNEIDGCGEDVAVPTFKLGLPVDSGLRQSLTKRPPSNMKKLMSRIEQFIRLEEDKGNSNTTKAENPVRQPNFKSPAQTNKVPQSCDKKIKAEPFFVWPPKLPRDPAALNQRPMCSYHRERGHLTENCYKFKSFLEQLVSDGHLSEYVNPSLTEQEKVKHSESRPGSSGTAPTGVIHVILSPLCTSINPASYRSDIQKAFHLRQSYRISDSAHLVTKLCSEDHVMSVNGTISFSDSDLHDVQLPHNDPLVITLRIGNYDVKRVLVDQGSFAEVMYQELYEKLGLGKSDLSEFSTPVFGFSGESTIPLGKTTLPVLAGPINLQTEFIVVQAPSPYNAIMGRSWLHKMKAIPSTLHQKLRFLTKDGVMEINGDQSPGTVEGESIRQEETEKVHFDPSEPELHFQVGINLSLFDKDELVTLLQEFRDVFAWSVYDAPGVSPSLACHSLAIPLDAKPVQQRRRKLPPERSDIIMEEVQKLLAAEAIRPVLYPTWLSNTVVVQKKNGKWRVCVDFTDLNKVCPKDHFPLPRIDQLVDSAAGHDRMSFLDAFQGYHQIPMTLSDQEKTAFITPRGAYCYKVMPFGLKNAGATYQRMMTTMFGNQIGKTVEVYIDDMLVKSARKEDHLAHLREVFEILRRDGLRLNASKCLFGVRSGKFLGHIISSRGIEANPDQISALVSLEEPKNTKQVQRLTGMVAALGRFISRSADKCRPFFQLLRKKRNFLWDEACSAAFQELKAYLASPPCLSIPSPGEPLYLYLAVSEHAVSAVLVRETPDCQRPIFFISKTMTEAESRYLPLEKAALALVRAAKKLPQYFQATTVTVLTDLPLKALLQCSDFSGRITRWGVQLGSLGVEYKPRISIKGQVLADFVAEFQGKDSEPEPTSNRGLETTLVPAEWKVVCRWCIKCHGIRSRGSANLPGRIACGAGREYQARDERMASYLRAVKNSLSAFEFIQVEQIGREHNSHADILAKLATAKETDMERTVTVEILDSPSSQNVESDVLNITRPAASWMDPLVAYLQNNQLPEDQKEADIVKRKAPGYWLSKEGSLYKRSFSGPYLLCVHPDLVNNLLYEIHEGICGSHTGGRSLAHRAMSQGYWWPYMQSDAVRYVRACDKCQRFAPKIHQPARELNPLSSPWPFAQWGIDIVGPLPRAPGNKKFLIVATDYFTKWVEAEPLAHIRDTDAKRFFWRNVVTRFGIPRAVISDNGTQFEGKVFKGFCSELGIKNFFSTPGYPQANGQAEVSNKVILDGIKKRLEEAKGKWVEELPSVLWTHRTTHRRSTGETPFALAYGVEAVIPLEVVANTRNPNDGKLGPNWEGPYKELNTSRGVVKLP
uniref:Uncharacterized protein n=1 Tax=Fagus sylvatica TaxID=28930 RepID=A0A2N9FR62_FAGSY